MRKPFSLTEGLVDKREQMLFEAYKNKIISSSRFFKAKIKKEYGFEPSSELYTAIVNYQIKKYGSKLTVGGKPMSREEANKRAEYIRKLRYQRRQGRRKDAV